jgi:hypothetical protein
MVRILPAALAHNLPVAPADLGTAKRVTMLDSSTEAPNFRKPIEATIRGTVATLRLGQRENHVNLRYKWRN